MEVVMASFYEYCLTMNIQLISRKEIKVEQWDSFILNANSGAPFLLSGWLDIACPGWSTYIISNANQEWIAVMPMPIKKWVFISEIRQPLFCMYGGIILKENIDQINIEKELLKKLKKDNYRIELYFPPKYLENNLQVLAQELNYVIKNRITYQIDLTQSWELIGTAKRNLQKSIREGWMVSDTESPDHFHLLLQNNPHIMPKKFQNRFVQLLNWAYTSGYLTTWTGFSKEGKLGAMVLILQCSKSAWYLSGAVLPEFRQSGIMTHLFNSAIHDYKKRGFTLFDFEGSQIPSIAKFFSGLGGSPISYLCLKREPLPKWLSWIR